MNVVEDITGDLINLITVSQRIQLMVHKDKRDALIQKLSLKGYVTMDDFKEKHCKKVLSRLFYW